MPSPDLVVPNAVIVTLRFNTVVAPMMNVLGAVKVGAAVINQTLANALDSAIKTAWTTHMAPLCGNQTALQSVGVRDINAPNLLEFIGVGASVLGTGVGDPLPRQSAFVVTLRTAMAGQRFRGRVYLGGFTEAQNDVNGQALTAVGTACVAFVTAVSTALTANGLTLAVVSRPSYATTVTKVTTGAGGVTDTDQVVRPARPGGAQAVIAIAARNTYWDSQRRRTSAGGASTLYSQPVAFADLTAAQEPAPTSSKR